MAVEWSAAEQAAHRSMWTATAATMILMMLLVAGTIAVAGGVRINQLVDGIGR